MRCSVYSCRESLFIHAAVSVPHCAPVGCNTTGVSSRGYIWTLCSEVRCGFSMQNALVSECTVWLGGRKAVTSANFIWVLLSWTQPPFCLGGTAGRHNHSSFMLHLNHFVKQRYVVFILFYTISDIFQNCCCSHIPQSFKMPHYAYSLLLHNQFCL